MEKEALTIQNNLKLVQERILQACIAAGRNPATVRLLLATKTVSAARIRVALAAGVNLLAENKLQELKAKHEDLQDLAPVHHFIGHLQSNKIKELLRYNVSCLQSLDRLDLAVKLNGRLLAAGKTMDVLLQVNSSGEASKFGVHPYEAEALLRGLSALPALRVKGLMTIGLFSAEEDRVRACFRRMRLLREELMTLAIPNVELQELSMGMSGDLELAIAEGATIVRVGTAVFGARMYPDSYYWNEA